jgi:hypothetical protein
MALEKFGNSREEDRSTFGWCLPKKDRLRFVLIVGVCDGRTLWNGFCVSALLPFSDPFVGLGVAGLQEESTEHIVPGNRY